jgi:hypothetical protein
MGTWLWLVGDVVSGGCQGWDCAVGQDEAEPCLVWSVVVDGQLERVVQLAL